MVFCLVLCLGFHSSVLILLMSRSMFLTSPFQPPPPSGILVPESYGFEFHFLAERFWVVDSSSVD
jgi:hypothetical protein